MALIVMDKTEYITKYEALLQDKEVYQHLIKDTSQTIHKELIKICKTTGITISSQKQNSPHWNLMASIPQAARFYGLPKIYKNKPPIVSACGTATYDTAKFISKILQNYCGKTSFFVKDSTDFIKKIKQLSINPEEETIVSFDVSVLFTSIPVPVAM